MNWDETFDSLMYADQVLLAERELASFIDAVREVFGPEQALLGAEDWLQEAELLDSPPRSNGRNWRAVTVAASARLANRLTVGLDQGIGTSTETKLKSTSQSNRWASTLLV